MLSSEARHPSARFSTLFIVCSASVLKARLFEERHDLSTLTAPQMRSSRKLWSDNAKRWKRPHASVRTSVSSSASPSAVLVLCQLQKEQDPRLFQGKYTEARPDGATHLVIRTRASTTATMPCSTPITLMRDLS